MASQFSNGASQVQTPLFRDPQQKWQLITSLGKGTYGRVDMVRNNYGHAVAVKSSIYKKEIRKEIEFLRILNAKGGHPNVVRYLDHVLHKNEDLCDSVMLELGCGNLFDMIRNPQEPFSERRVVRFFLQVVEGLKFIHSRNLVHCDLKSGNIIYGFERKLKIADFGLSHVGSKAMRGPVGTHQICAPEAFFSGYYDGKKNDVWALGILFIEMLNGRYLWKSPQKTDEDFTKFIRLISTAKMESRSQWGFVQFVLQKDPKKRPGLAQIQRHPYISGISKATPLRIAGPCRAIPYHAQSKLFGVDEPNFVVRI